MRVGALRLPTAAERLIFSMKENITPDLRQGLPEALRYLVAEYPRDIWSGHRNFEGLTRFWLERHVMFRQVLARLEQEAEAMLDGKMEARRYQQQTARLAGLFLNQLDSHHQVEDQHYFPQLAALEPPLARGFEILDADHHLIDGHLNRLADTANAMLRADPLSPLTDVVGALKHTYERIAPFLNRHLLDEEELVVPVILKHGPLLHG
jgi:iron-sulfur cluster repair protein YtfE (RIC family)